MKRLLAVVATVVSGFALSSAAQTAPSGAAAPLPAKIAVITFQAAVNDTNEFQRDFADMQKKYDPKRQQLKDLSDEIGNLEKQLQAQAEKLSDSERASRAKTIDEKRKQAQRIQEDAQSDFKTDFQELFGKVAGKVGDVMVAYAKQQGFTLVLDASVSQQESPLVLYALPTTDITKAVIDAYNVKSGVPAPPAQPAAAAPSPSKPPATAH